jgi:hypothetical protein
MALFVAACAALLAGPVTTSAAVRPAVAAPAERVGREFKIKVGRTVTFRGESLRVKLKSVASDSRCPRNVECVWAGNAEVFVETSAKGVRGAKKVLRLNTNASPERPAEGKYRRYTVKLVGLDPYPQNPGKIAPRQYTATLLVSKE